VDRSPQGAALALLLRTTARPVADVLPVRSATLRFATTIAGAPALWTNRRVTVERVDDVGELVRARGVTAERTILHLHGGGFVFGDPASHRALAESLSVTCRAEVLLPDYRHPPEATVTIMVEDCLAAYRRLLDRQDPDRIVLSGDSAGGNLVFATAVAARDAGLPMPAGLVGMSAWLDLTAEHPRGTPRDAFTSMRFARRAARLCADGTRALCPLETDVAGLPPVLLQCGDREPMRPGNERMARHLAAAGVPCELQLWSGQVHAFQVFGRVLPEARAATREIGRFTREVTS
jgi:acetyl esterase/lipase